ncbi:hypothetical protein PVAP13_2NG398903, partial [Panicum virgatum]
MNAMVDSIMDAVENAIKRGNQSGGVRRFMVQGAVRRALRDIQHQRIPLRRSNGHHERRHWNGTITSGGADATSAAKERQRRRHGWTSWGTSIPHQRRRCRELATGLRLRHQCRPSTPTTTAPPALLHRHRLQSPQRTPIREYPWGRIRLLRGGGVSPPLRATTRAGRGRFAPADQPPWP